MLLESTSSLKICSDLKNLSTIRCFVKEAADKVELVNEKIEELQLAVDEACANIIQHGYKKNSGDINIHISLDNEKITIYLSDNAPLYNPMKESPAPRLDEPLEKRALGGMGVLIVKENTDKVEYKVSEDGGNILIMTKYLHN